MRAQLVRADDPCLSPRTRAGSDASSTATAAMTAVGSPLVAAISGPSGDVLQSAGSVAFTASGSYDPDDR